MIKGLALMSSVIFSLPVFAQAFDYYDAHAVGWHWYQDPISILAPAPLRPLQPSPAPDSIARLHAAQKTLEAALDTAILLPTPAHVERYLRLQNAVSARSTQFAALWQQVLLNHPELDFSLANPTESLALQVRQDQDAHSQDALLHAFAKQSGLFFFYKQACPYCARFAPILQHFAAATGITVIPITLDGKALPEFPESRKDQGQAALFGVQQTPALFAVNPRTHKAFPVAYGLTSESGLRARIVQSKGLLE